MLELGKVSLFLHLIVGELHRQSLRNMCVFRSNAIVYR